ncbi:hypothetical protein [Pedobacter sp. HDW13]|uniref:hypothetical protein n=1 Tax=Pedobacter sp. HDW13 TaxID=2714940 RepID=UPI001F0F1115|nr:hypothetical protein [Pedobacter sp. HDW13]
MKLIKLSLFTAFLLSLHFNLKAQEIIWKEVEQGVWKGVFGTPEPYDLLKASGAKPNHGSLNRLGTTVFPFANQPVIAQVSDGKTYLRIPLDKTEQLYGFGLNFQTVHQRGKILELHVDHYGGKDNGRTHAPTPFYISSNGYGVFINSARYIKVWAGTTMRKDSKNFPVPKDRNSDKGWSSRNNGDEVEILVPAPGVEIYVFGGPRPLDAVKRYNLFNGGGYLPRDGV